VLKIYAKEIYSNATCIGCGLVEAQLLMERSSTGYRSYCTLMAWSSTANFHRVSPVILPKGMSAINCRDIDLKQIQSTGSKHYPDGPPSAIHANSNSYLAASSSLCSTNPINSPAGIPRAAARLKIVASAGPFSARSRALMWLRSVFASSARRSCVNARPSRSSCNTSPKITVGRLLSRIGG